MTETTLPGADETTPVYDRLRDDIVSGVHRPGHALRFADLQERYGLGVGRLREALSQLAADRLVVREVNRGFRVPKASLADFDDIAAMRLRLEPGAFRVSVETGDAAWEERVLIAAHRLHRAARRTEAGTVGAVQDEWERCHRAFHAALIGACGSPMTLHFCNSLYDHFDRYRRLAGFDAPAQERLARQHRDLADCVAARSVGAAGTLLAEHVARTVATVRPALEQILP